VRNFSAGVRKNRLGVRNCIKIGYTFHIRSIGLIQYVSGLFCFNKVFFSIKRVDFNIKSNQKQGQISIAVHLFEFIKLKIHISKAL
jgi:hypothetical protein